GSASNGTDGGVWSYLAGQSVRPDRSITAQAPAADVTLPSPPVDPAVEDVEASSALVDGIGAVEGAIATAVSVDLPPPRNSASESDDERIPARGAEAGTTAAAESENASATDALKASDVRVATDLN